MKNLIVIFGVALAVIQTVQCCQCIPPRLGSQVCGSDGKTYRSDCLLFCERIYKTEKQPCLTKVSNGECDPSPCICSDRCSYVCASDGQTYGNDCTLKCAQQFNSTLTKVKDGKCNDNLF